MKDKNNLPKDKQPNYIIFLKVVFSILVLVGIVSIFLCIFGGENYWGIFIFLALFSIGIAIIIIPVAFSPEIAKMKAQKDRYIQKQNEQLLEDIQSRDADINYRATKKYFRARREGLHLEKCPFCGDNVSGDEWFCNMCGKELYKECKKCGKVHSFDSKFCKSCGEKLD